MQASSAIGPAFVQTMAAYNMEMNRRVYAAASRLSDDERRRDRGAFWRSIHGTLSHLIWGDEMWLSRLAALQKPTATLVESASYLDDFGVMQRRRQDLDATITAWAGQVTQDWLAGELAWFSGAAQCELRRPRALLVAHFFNHQTHHRGQAHAMITAAGEQTGETDLFLLV